MPIDDMPEDMTGEVALYAGVIRCAVRDWIHHRNSKNVKLRTYAEDARRWLFGYSIEPNSLKCVCDFIGMDMTLVRSRAKQLASEHLTKRRNGNRE
jgi:hypothetical protein